MVEKRNVVAVCASGDDPESALIAERFARCAFFHIYRRGEAGSRFLTNHAGERAGSAAAAAVAALSREGVELVMGRRFGTKALEAFQEFEIEAEVTELPCLSDVAQWLQREVF